MPEMFDWTNWSYDGRLLPKRVRSTTDRCQPMYYYCKACGIHVATLPEDWWKDPPPTYCVNCKDLVADGVIAREDTYEEWLSKWPATSPSPDTTTTP
jgi:hypothetical protein